MRKKFIFILAMLFTFSMAVYADPITEPPDNTAEITDGAITPDGSGTVVDKLTF